MNIVLIGYGKMGKEIDRLIGERGWNVVKRLDSKSPRVTAQEMENVDVGLHFARPETVIPAVEDWLRWGKSLVIGTTGWHGELTRVQSLLKKGTIGIVYASNFSLGANLFLKILQEAGGVFDRFPEYDVAVQEIHHKRKVDSPSGTALAIANLLLARIRRKKEILAGSPPGAIRGEQLQITSTRAGETVGTHSVRFDSPADTIELTHTAKNRTGFALGALLAAEWVRGKQGLFTMDEVLEDVLR